MARYLDTSLLIPLFIKEPRTPDVHAWFSAIAAPALVVSEWGVTEFASAASIKTRTGEIDGDERAKAQEAFRRFVTGKVKRVEPETADFQRAAELCDCWQLGVRAGDALHLAIAERLGLTICTLDKGMLDAARALGMLVEAV